MCFANHIESIILLKKDFEPYSFERYYVESKNLYIHIYNSWYEITKQKWIKLLKETVDPNACLEETVDVSIA